MAQFTLKTEIDGQVSEQILRNDDLLDTAYIVLLSIGHPAHHKVMWNRRDELGLGDGDIATAIWRNLNKKDESKHDQRFLFLGKSVYGLRGRDEGKDPADYAPDGRGARNHVQTPAQIQAEIARLQALLIGTATEVTEVAENDEDDTTE